MSFSSSLAIPVIVLTCIGVAVGEFPGLKMNRATIALVAAVLLVVLQIITPSAALKAIDPGTLLLLFSMMINSAHRDIDIFQLVHFTQLSLTSPPNSVILVLDSENQSVFRFSPRSFELQNQVTGFAGAANPFKPGSVTAMAVSPNHVLYLAIGDDVYFATNLP